MTLLTVILNWRTADMTLLAAEAALREMESIDGAITIVDNDSGDGSEARLRQGVQERGWPEDRVRVLQSGWNGGYGAGNNFGIQAGLPGGGRPDLVYVLNSDAFPDRGAIRALMDHLDRTPQAGFVGSYIHGPDGAAHTTTFRFPSVAGEFEGAACLGPITRLFADWSVPIPTPETSQRVDWLAGASLMMRHSVLDRIGLFDEGFFLYYEETDLCRRAALAGHETHFVRESSVTHIGSASTGMKEWRSVPDYWFDSRLRYFVKHHGNLTAAAATLATLSGSLLNSSRKVLTGRGAEVPQRFLQKLLLHHFRALVHRSDRPRSPAPAE